MIEKMEPFLKTFSIIYYSRVHINLDEVFSKILKKPVQKK